LRPNKNLRRLARFAPSRLDTDPPTIPEHATTPIAFSAPTPTGLDQTAPEPVPIDRIRRRRVLNGLINEYHPAA
jgi:hypothetical protein